MKVVLDTNIWVSAVIWGGVPDEIVQLAEQGRITIAMSQELLDELENRECRGEAFRQSISACQPQISAGMLRPCLISN